MKMKEKQVTLKNGTNVTIKTVSANEVDALLRFLNTAGAETDYLPLTKDEIASVNKKDLQNDISEYEHAKKAIYLAAYEGGEIVATCIIEGVSALERTNHRAKVSVAVKRDLWNAGLGSAILGPAVDFAGKVGYGQIECDSVTENVGALLLLGKYGFSPVGSFPKAYMIDGTLHDAVRFVKYLGNDA